MTTTEQPTTTMAKKNNSIIICAGDVQDTSIMDHHADCEWVDDAVLNLSAAFTTLCHTSQCLDYVDQQVQYEHLVLRGGNGSHGGFVDSTKQQCSLVDHSFLDDLGLEVEVNGILCHHHKG